MPSPSSGTVAHHIHKRRLVDLRASIANPVGRTVFRLIEKPVEKLLSLSDLNRLYSALSPEAEDRTFFTTALRQLGVAYELSPEDVVKIPATGPLVVVANHPFGAIDGLLMGDILTALRPDFRLLANRFLHAIPELQPWILPLDPFGSREAHRRNLSCLRQAIRWIDDGGALGIFPAGTVSHFQLRQGCVVDPKWHTTVARLVRRTGAIVLTMFFDGRNSMTFQLSGLIHPKLRTALLPAEMLKRRQSRVSVLIGRPIGRHKIARYEDDDSLTQYFRFKTYMLKWRDCPIRPRFSTTAAPSFALPLLSARPPEVLAAEVRSLSASTHLAEHGKFQVFLVRSEEIPSLLVEIGQLRERTFRGAGEGTGEACDLDRFDAHYQHLFLWNSEQRQVVGSYRLGHVDRILRSHGERGLYTNTLFKLKPGLVERLGPCLELGRSFVREEYQGQPIPLTLMWRGIGTYLVRNPEYKVLFGPVSISKQYAALSRRLMVEFLGKRCGHETLAELVRPRNPPRDRLTRAEREALSSVVRNAEDISALVSDIESDDKGIPILLRHYLRLNACLLSFNLDASFGDCIDGLIVVDLRAAEPKVLHRYMGTHGYQRYMRVPGSTPVLAQRARS